MQPCRRVILSCLAFYFSLFTLPFSSSSCRFFVCFEACLPLLFHRQLSMDVGVAASSVIPSAPPASTISRGHAPHRHVRSHSPAEATGTPFAPPTAKRAVEDAIRDLLND